jgi:hypothetical protein
VKFDRIVAGFLARETNGKAMREKTVKRQLAAGKQLVGTMVFEFATPGFVRITYRAGMTRHAERVDGPF